MSSHLSLYLKYRPQTFDQLEGQKHIKQTLKNASKEGRIAHAYLFAGPRGTGKTSSARILAKAITCENIQEDGNPCDTCEFCTSVQSGSLVDLIEIDAASNRGIDEIRAIKERINFAPNVAKKKVYIIDEVHMLSKDASNALLKTLEEPPSHVHFILATTEAHKILSTIISRCQYFQFYPISEDEIVERLEYVCKEEKCEYDREALQIIAEEARGGLRDALSLLEKVSFQSEKLTVQHVQELLGKSEDQLYIEITSLLQTGDSEQLLEKLDQVWKTGMHPAQFLQGLMGYARKGMLQEAMSTREKTPSLLFHIDLITALTKAKEQSKYAMFPTLPVEMALVKTKLHISEADLSAYASTNITSHSNIGNDVQPDHPKKIEATNNIYVIPDKSQRDADLGSIKESLLSNTPADARSEQPIVEETPQAPKKKSSITKHSIKEPVQEIPEKHQEVRKNEAKEVEDGDSPSLGEIKRRWDEVCKKLPTTLIRIALKDYSRPVALEGTELTIAFKTAFNLEKGSQKQHLDQLQALLKEAHGTSYTFKTILDEKILVTSNTVTKKKEVKQIEKKEVAETDIEAIAALFDGKVVE